MKILKSTCIILVVALVVLVSFVVVSATSFVGNETVVSETFMGDEATNAFSQKAHESTTEHSVQPTFSSSELCTYPELPLVENVPPLSQDSSVDNDTESTEDNEQVVINKWEYLPIVNHIEGDKTTYTIVKVEKNKNLPYLLYIPSTASKNNPLPLVIWLHGSGERGLKPSSYLHTSFPKVLSQWNLNNPNAYIVCPILNSSDDWATPRNVHNINDIINEVIEMEYINEKRISLTGASLGGIGSLYIGGALNDRLYRIVTFSGYPCGNCIKEITIPIIGFVGHPSYGEDIRSYEYMTKTFYREFGTMCIKVMNSSHGGLPNDVFRIDENKDGYSDIFMWLIGE